MAKATLAPQTGQAVQAGQLVQAGQTGSGSKQAKSTLSPPSHTWRLKLIDRRATELAQSGWVGFGEAHIEKDFYSRIVATLYRSKATLRTLELIDREAPD